MPLRRQIEDLQNHIFFVKSELSGLADRIQYSRHSLETNQVGITGDNSNVLGVWRLGTKLANASIRLKAAEAHVAVVLFDQLRYNFSLNFGCWLVEIPAPLVGSLSTRSSHYTRLFDCLMKCVGTPTQLVVASSMLRLFLNGRLSIEVEGDRFVFGSTELRKPPVQFISNVTEELFHVNDDIAKGK